MKKYFLLFFVLISCSMEDNQLVELTGEVAIQPKNTNKIIIYSNNDSSFFNIPDRDEYSYSGFTWLNNMDALLCIENIETSKKIPIKSNLVLINKNGRLLEKLTYTKKGEFVDYVYPSPNDSFLIITLYKNENKDVRDIFTSLVSMQILKYKDKSIVCSSNNISPRMNFEMNESPWSPDENKIVYSIISRSLVIGAENPPNKFPVDPGIYIYDIFKDKHIKILNHGYNAIWSPIENYIAYIDKNNVYLYNTKTEISSRLYCSEKNKIDFIHWTIDGKYLLVIQSKQQYYFDIAIYEIFINIENGNIIKVDKPKFGLNNFTWKGSIRIIN